MLKKFLISLVGVKIAFDVLPISSCHPVFAYISILIGGFI